MAAILWAPIGAGLGYLGGKWSESSWEPCRQVLQESISKFDPMAALATKLKGALDHAGVQTLAIGTEAGVGNDVWPATSRASLPPKYCELRFATAVFGPAPCVWT